MRLLAVSPLGNGISVPQPGRFAAALLLLIGGGLLGQTASGEPHAADPADKLAAHLHVSGEYAADTILVGFRNVVSANARQLAHARVGGARVHAYSRIPVEVVRLGKGQSVEQAIKRYSALPEVAFAEPNYRVYALNAPNDPLFSSLWGLHNTGQTGGTPSVDIGALEAWATTTGSSEIIVGVIDTGIDYNHPDLAPNLWVNEAELNGTPGVDDDGNGIVDDIYGARWTGGNGLPTSGDPMDGHGHGTHVAGTIGAAGNNGIGVVGVNWHVRLMGLKFLPDEDSGSTADAISAIEYAVAMGAHLTNNSWGGGGESLALQQAIEAADAAGQLFVAAAGNLARDNDIINNFPSNYDVPNMVAVASSTHTDTRSSFSNFGRTTVHLAAPGSDIVSTWPLNVQPMNYHSISGTSMAAPHVAGVAALLHAARPDASHHQVKEWLLGGVTPLPDWMRLVSTGGRLNAAESLRLASLPEFALPPAGFEARSEAGEDFVTIFWELPEAPQLESVMVRRGTEGFPKHWTEGNLVYERLDTDTVDGPHAFGQTFYYTAWAFYPGDHVSAAVYGSARVGGEPDDYFTESFSQGIDLEGKSLTLVPEASLNAYRAYTDNAADFPTDPAGGVPLTLGDDAFQEVTLNASQVALYGEEYSTFYVGSNGFITFGSGDTSFSPTLARHFNQPRISPLFVDLNPAAAGVVSLRELPDRVAVTFEGVTQYSPQNSNSFQVEMFFDGTIRMTWLQLEAATGIVGVSAGNGVPENFAASDLSAYPPSLVSVPGDFDGDGRVDLQDLLLLLDGWGSTYALADLLALLDNWGTVLP